MNRISIAAVAGTFALAAVLGTIAATHTVSLGATNRHASGAALRVQQRKLDRFEASLRRQLAKKPPKLPAVPKASPVATPAAPAQQQPQQVIYRRPPPVVVVKHTHHGDDGSEHEGSDGGGGESD